MKATIVFSDHNAPTLCIDGKPVAPVLYGLSDIPGSSANTAQAHRNIKAFAEAGVQLVTADTGLHLGWYKQTPFDPEPLIEEIGAVLDANPHAGIFLRLHMNPPYSWLRDHPEECVVYRKKTGDVLGVDNGESDRLIRFDGNEHLRASLASRLWIQEASEKLVLFLKALQGTREGDALIGIQVAGGIYGEWHNWGQDVSLPMRRRFTEHLREKYPTVEALRTAWHDDTVTYETAEFHPERYGTEGEGSLREPQFAQAIIDARQTIQLASPEAILAFCRVVKETAPHLLVGSFYAYYFTSMDEHNTVYGHLYPELLFRAKGTVDFLCGPMAYCENRDLDGVPMQRSLLESCRLNGILWLTEMDQHPFGTEKYVGGDPALLAENIAVLRRNAFQPLLSGHGFWFYDHRIIPSLIAPDSENPSAASVYRKTGWWETKPLMEAIAKINEFANLALQKEYKHQADVLLVYDTESFFYRAVCQDEKYLLHESLARAGVVFDTIYKKDFHLCNADNYKMIVFVNCYFVTEEARALLCRQKALTVYLNGFGSFNGACYSEENASLSAGMRLAKTDASCFTYGGEAFSIKEEYRPVYAVCDEEASPLALYENGLTAVARKGNAVYIPLPYVPKSLAKVLLREAGAHTYTDSGESVLAGYGYLAVCCQRAGERTVYLPSGKTVTVTTEGYETVLLDMESGEKLPL